MTIAGFSGILIGQILRRDKTMKTAKMIVVVLLAAKAALAQNWVEERTYISGGVATPRIGGLLTKAIKGNLGGFCWFQTQQKYSQIYGGSTLSPTSWIQLALGLGIETDKHPLRVGSYVWLGKDKLSGLAVFEDGGSGFWYKVETNYQASKLVGLGTLSERFKGSGPKIEFSIPHTALKLWIAPLVDRHSFRPVIGVRWSL